MNNIDKKLRSAWDNVRSASIKWDELCYRASQIQDNLYKLEMQADYSPDTLKKIDELKKMEETNKNKCYTAYDDYHNAINAYNALSEIADEIGA